MKSYEAKTIEPKWQERWAKKGCFTAHDFSSKPKFYSLVEFPYPSGVGMHVGHIRAYTSLEVVSRMKRLQGYNVLFPMGWDAFGLPTENFAIKTKQHPRKVTDNNITNFVRQLKSIGYSFDWDRTIDTTSPEYFKWTQWIFLQMYKRGLAYKSHTYVNFCPTCKVVLANEESQGGVCDRCGSQVVQKEKDVWFLKIRAYADRLLDGLDKLDFLPRIKLEQRSWIGRSYGAEVDFQLNVGEKLKVFTTRCDTLFGVTFMVIAPEHPIIDKHKNVIANYDKVVEYREAAKRKSEFQRVQLQKDKTGVKVEGIVAINPVTGKEVPVFVADYVMMEYGTGAIMAVPGHDTRDWDFAKAFGADIIEVIKGGNVEEGAYTDIQKGVLVNSGFLNGLSVEEAKEKMLKFLEEKGIGGRKVNYNMKDWAFNRQRYWGEPIPIIYCDKCGMVPVPEEDLPLTLPDLESYEPTDTGESPLANVEDWVNCTCPKCGGKARRETDTMPQWAGSSWYFLRYADNKNDKALADMDKLKYWGQVDWYNGGMEHVTRHLIYSRFWNMFLYDIGAVPFEEPYARRTAQGLLLGENNEKMSKSAGNVVNPDDCVNAFGADVLRTFVMFIGDYERPAPWSDKGMNGCRRFLERVWRLQEIVTQEKGYSDKHRSEMHKLIKKVTDDYNDVGFNTAIAQMMSFVNTAYADNYVTRGELETLITLLYPVAPHICEEINECLGNEKMIAESDWPVYEEKYLTDAIVELPVQVMGKLKGTVIVARDSASDVVQQAAMEKYPELFEGKTIVKVICVPNKIINFILR